jgi:hypothetical protein
LWTTATHDTKRGLRFGGHLCTYVHWWHSVGHMAGITKKANDRRGKAGYSFALAGDARHVFRRAGLQRWYHVEGGGFLPMLVRLGVSPDGVYQCTGIAFGLSGDADDLPPAIAARGLRIPLTDIVAGLAAWTFDGKTWPRSAVAGQVEGPNELIGLYQSGASSTLRVPLGRRPKSDVFYEQFANDYRMAEKEDPRRPMKVLQTMWLDVEPRTLKRYIQVARQRRLLEKWEPPKRRKGRRRR